MRLEKRDWLILRARLRRFVSLAALPVMTTLTAPASASARPDPSEATREPTRAPRQEIAPEADALALAKAGGVEVVQCNAFYGGAYERPDRSLRKTFATATRFARMLAREHAAAAVVGMQQIETSGDADRVRDILMAETGHAWRVRWFNRHGGPNAVATPGVAIFWRPAVLDLVEDFGTKDLAASEVGRRTSDTESARFGGLLLEQKGTTRRLAVFIGALGEADASAIEEADARADHVAVLRRWIDEKTASHDGASRVVMTDMNAAAASAPHEERRDSVFWDQAPAKMRAGGIFGEPVVSADFGSDHRFVAARVYLRAEGE